MPGDITNRTGGQVAKTKVSFGSKGRKVTISKDAAKLRGDKRFSVFEDGSIKVNPGFSARERAASSAAATQKREQNQRNSARKVLPKPAGPAPAPRRTSEPAVRGVSGGTSRQQIKDATKGAGKKKLTFR